MSTAPVTSPASADPVQVRRMLAGAVENLRATWHADAGLFPFSSRLTPGGEVVNDYDHPIAVRYTINSLLGLVEAAAHGREDVGTGEAEALCRRFEAAGNLARMLPADHGLDAVLAARRGLSGDPLARRVARLEDLLGRPATVRRLCMQDLAWLLWGGAAAAEAGADRGRDVASRALALILDDFVDPGSGLPRHSTRRYRRDTVSFGSLVYFLRAMHEAAHALGDERAASLFTAGVRRAIELQGPLGEWPWMINCRTGLAFDAYPVFAVHQDGMAMLFLHPAQDAGLAEAGAAAARSLAWDFGANELGRAMFVEEPFFFAFRSIERTERAPRARRYLRSLRSGARTSTVLPGGAAVRINDECRSYHLGWTLFSWAGRPEAIERS